jgi:hypothetical protein
MTDQGLTPGELSTRRARRARVYDSGAWSAMVTAVSAGVVAFLCWLAYALVLGNARRPGETGTVAVVLLAVAIAATAFSAAFSAAYLVLRTIQRDAGIDED